MLRTYPQQNVQRFWRWTGENMEHFFRPLISKIRIFYMMVFISIFRELLVNHVNVKFIFVSVISSKPGVETDYKNLLIHPARDESYSEVTKIINHYLMITSHPEFFQK